MKLLRLSILYFEPAPEGWHSWSLKFDKTEVKTMGAWNVEKKLRLLVVAEIELARQPELTADRLIVVPEYERKQAEAAIETAANLIAVAENCKRSISSPIPSVALLPKDTESRVWLESTKGFFVKHSLILGAKFQVNKENILNTLSDRLDGVALLAEALSHEHSTGRFHEFLRLFERAFVRSSTNLVKPLAKFLNGINLGYTEKEVKRWVVDLRHPATHADRRPNFILESDIRPVIKRMEQATYDVLFNKTTWHTPSVERRQLWVPLAGTSSDSTDAFIVKGSAVNLRYQLLDEFSSYPMDLSASLNSLPKDWWSKYPEHPKVNSTMQVK